MDEGRIPTLFRREVPDLLNRRVRRISLYSYDKYNSFYSNSMLSLKCEVKMEMKIKYNGILLKQRFCTLLTKGDLQRIAVGFYTDGNGNNYAHKLDQNKGKFIEIPTATIPGAVSVMATGINHNGDIVGTFTDANGTMHGFLLRANTVSVFDSTSVANVTSTAFLGINDFDQIVGTVTVGTGNTAQMHGFLLSNPLHHAQWQSIDDPNGIGTTTINGLNDNADLIGFYVDGNGNTDGFLTHRS